MPTAKIDVNEVLFHLTYSCLSRLFCWSVLKQITMKAVALVWVTTIVAGRETETKKTRKGQGQEKG